MRPDTFVRTNAARDASAALPSLATQGRQGRASTTHTFRVDRKYDGIEGEACTECEPSMFEHLVQKHVMSLHNVCDLGSRGYR